jgi:NAD(P)-dependent dehydrogenase (short-subunit alcohol dehydrogenase family)
MMEAFNTFSESNIAKSPYSFLVFWALYAYVFKTNRKTILAVEVPLWVLYCRRYDVCCWASYIAIVFQLCWRFARDTGKDQKVEGAVFVTGCDSGMGEETANHLARVGYHVFAGCYDKRSFSKYTQDNVTPVEINVKDEGSVAKAQKFVQKCIDSSGGAIKGLYGVLQCAGIAYTAPFEYIPLKMFKDQIDVNYYGYVHVCKAFLPMVKAATSAPGARRGRFAFVSSGPLPGPGVPFITSYMGAKWAGDALCQGLRMELKLRELPIDCSMISPGIVKPTRLAAEGEILLKRTFEQMPAQASNEYLEMVDAFRK